MRSITRKSFLSKSGKGLAGTALGGLAWSGLSPARVLGANERVSVALIGCGGRGKLVTRHFIDQGAAITYVCDLHEERLEEAAGLVAELQGRRPKKTKDMHEVFDAKGIDAVLIGTPDHWHGPMSILACQAGKDVYVEKPHAHNIWESRKMVEAARKYERILQVGTQNRSAAYNHAAREYVKSGQLGEIHLVKVYNLKSEKTLHLGQTDPPPKGFNWDAWLGPAPQRPYHSNIFRSGWHHFWDFSGGDLADDGIHQLDLAMMLLGNPGLPVAVSCSGGRFHYRDDDSEVPDLQIAAFDFEGLIMTLEHTNYPRYMRKTTGTIRRKDEFPYWTQNATRVELYGSELMMTVGRHGGGWQVVTSGGKVVEQMYGRPADTPHVQDFLECVKSRKRSNADIEIAHPAGTMMHMANIAHRVGNVKLRVDTGAERFIDSTEANRLVKRTYRKGYEVPERV